MFMFAFCKKRLVSCETVGFLQKAFCFFWFLFFVKGYGFSCFCELTRKAIFSVSGLQRFVKRFCIKILYNFNRESWGFLGRADKIVNNLGWTGGQEKSGWGRVACATIK